MKIIAIGLTCFSLSILPGTAQIKEPARGGLSKKDYMTMLIDSLDIAEKSGDTARVISYAAVLTNEFQTAPMVDRAVSYMQLALRYAKAYSDPTMFADLCNRTGMLMPSLCVTPGSDQCNEILDSSRYWYRQAVAQGMALNLYQTAGWGYRGLLYDAVHYPAAGLVRDSISFYYRRAQDLATRVNDTELAINCDMQYGYYLSKIGDWKGLGSLMEKRSSRLDQMTPTQKFNFYLHSHDYLAASNNLDTLRALRETIMEIYQYRVAAQNREELYAKDQQYEVSKTKVILDETANRLDVTNRVLIVSIISLVAFALLVTYLFLLFRKNKRLSQRNELLLREQNHRVKNNLQMISSLLSLQSQKLHSADAKDALEESQSRINSVALLHRMLYEGNHVGKVEVTAYIRSLTEEVRYSAGREMEIALDLPQKLELKIEKVTSLGLIINELLINSIKHVSGTVKLRVSLQLSITGNTLHLIYADNGTGVDPQTWASSESFGNQLVQIQSAQLEGGFEVSCQHGFRYELTISV